MTLDVWPIRKALRDLLVADATLMGLVGGVYDAVPQNAPPPYVVFGATRTEDWSTATTPGVRATFRLHVFSGARGRKEGDAILERVRGLVHRAAVTVSGLTVAMTRAERGADTVQEEGRAFEATLDVTVWAHG